MPQIAPAVAHQYCWSLYSDDVPARITGTIVATGVTLHAPSTGPHLCEAISQAIKRATGTTIEGHLLLCTCRLVHIISYDTTFVACSVMNKSMQLL